MKVYSNNKHQRRGSMLSPTVAGNISALAAILQPQSEHQTHTTRDGENQTLTLARQFVSALNDPYRTMLLYPLVIDSHCTYSVDPIFQQTTYPPELHPLLSLYLHKLSAYSSFQRHSRKIIDIFYLFLLSQAPSTLASWLQTEHRQSLGQWFFSECIAGFCQLLFHNKKEYTAFLGNFMQYGLSYLFMTAASCLRNEGPPECQQIAVKRIRTNFIERYTLQDS